MQQQPSDFIPQGRLKITEGDASIPESGGMRYIIQICGDNGKGEQNRLSARWPAVDSSYRIWYRSSFNKMSDWIGQIKTAQVQSDTVIVHMLARTGDKQKLDEEGLRKALDATGKEVTYNSGSVHMNKAGTAREWKTVEKLIKEQLLRRGINVTIYQPKK
jgi:hypothetical protein